MNTPAEPQIQSVPSTPRRASSRSGAALLGGAVVAAAGGGAAAIALLASPASGAVTLTVTSSADGAPQASDCTTPVANSCSLRDALAAAQNGDTITFSLPAPSVILLSYGSLVIEDSVSIIGPGRSNLAIDAQRNSRVFEIGAGAVGGVTISGTTLRNGNSGQDSGAGISATHRGDLTLDDVALDSNVGRRAAAFQFEVDDLTLRDVLITGNSGELVSAGMVYPTGSVVIDRVVSRSNTATGGNSGLRIITDHQSTPSSVTVTNSTFEGSSTPFGVSGLDVWLNDFAAEDLSIVNSTFSGNAGPRIVSAILGSGDTFTMANSTVSGNTSSDGTSGVYVSLYADSTLDILQSTITGNNVTATGQYVQGSGLAVWTYGLGQGPSHPLTITGSIIAGNTGVAGVSDIGLFEVTGMSPAAVRSTSSIIGTSSRTITDMGGTQRDVLDLGLSPLASNGGLTKTMALSATSPALDVGPSNVPTFSGNGFDQRGTGFSRVSNGRVDIGAFERQVIPPTTTSTTSTSTTSTSTTSTTTTRPPTTTTSTTRPPTTTTTRPPTTTTTAPAYSVSFNANGGTGTMTAQSIRGSAALTSNTFTRAGYTFAGWATSQNGSVAYANGASISPTGAVTLYAKWTAINYTVTFNANGGSGSMSAMTFTAAGRALTANAFTRTGYTFAGWSTTQGGSATISNSATYSTPGNVTLYAKWTAINYTVTFNANGGSGSMASQTTTVAGTALRTNSFTRTGYRFDGWATSQNGAVVYANGATYNAAAGATLYAKWTAVFTVTFNANGGTGSMAAQVVPTTGATLRANSFTKQGKTFNGWSTTQNGILAYSNSATIRPTRNITLYAIWR